MISPVFWNFQIPSSDGVSPIDIRMYNKLIIFEKDRFFQSSSGSSSCASSDLHFRHIGKRELYRKRAYRLLIQAFPKCTLVGPKARLSFNGSAVDFCKKRGIKYQTNISDIFILFDNNNTSKYHGLSGLQLRRPGLGGRFFESFQPPETAALTVYGVEIEI